MKRCTILALALVLGCTMFTGCRRGNGDMMTVPPTTQAATEHYTMPATQPTRPTETEPATQEATTASVPDRTADATEGTTGDNQSRARGMSPATR